MTGTTGVTGRHAVGQPRRTFGQLLAGGVLASLALLTPVATGTAAAQAAPSTTTPAAASARWLLTQLDRNGDLIPGVAAGVPDVGVSSDTLLGLAAAGDADDPEFAATTRAIATHLTGYAVFPTGHATALLAGPLAKTLLVAEVGGGDPTDFGGWNLPVTLRSMLTTAGPNAGRFADQLTGADSSNGFSQVFAILGLVHTAGGVPSSAVNFLLDQQCPSGAFRLFYDTTGGCPTNAEQDSDATAMAVQALTALMAADPQDGRLSPARTAAAGWLAALQDGNGGVSGTGPTKGDNANTTALAAVAFRESGLVQPALAAERYVAGLQLTQGPDAGAVAYNASARSLVGATGTITQTSLDQWQRATSQAILAFGLPGYNALQERAGSPIPAPTTTATATPAPTTTAPATPVPAGGGHPADAGTPPAAAAPAPVVTDGTDPYGTDPYDTSGDVGDLSDDPGGGIDPSPAAGAANGDAGKVDPGNAAGQAAALPQVAGSPAPPLSGTHPTSATVATADNSTPEAFWFVLAIGGGIGAGALALRFAPRRR